MKNICRSAAARLGAYRTQLIVATLLLHARIASAGDAEAFNDLYTRLTDWAQGSLGKSISIIFLLCGLAVGVAKGQLYAAVVAIACGLTLMIAPSVIESIFASA